MKKTEKVLSISIAAYNVEAFLEDTVSSLTGDKETLRKLDILIVNDGSADRTGELARRLAQQHPDSIRVIDKENGGYGSTVNASLAAAEGIYYKLLDGDDRFDPANLRDFVLFLETADADLIVSPFCRVYGNEAVLADDHPEIGTKSERISALRLAVPVFQMHELAVRTAALRRLNSPIAEHCFYTDLEFVFYCLLASGTIARFPRPVYRYRLGVDGQSVSLSGIRKHYRNLMTVLERVCRCYTERQGEQAPEKTDILADALSNVFFQKCLQEGMSLFSHPAAGLRVHQ